MLPPPARAAWRNALLTVMYYYSLLLTITYYYLILLTIIYIPYHYLLFLLLRTITCVAVWAVWPLAAGGIEVFVAPVPNRIYYLLRVD